MRVGLIRAIPLAKRRFRLCRQAYEMIVQNENNETGNAKKNKNEAEQCPCMNSDSTFCCLADMAVMSCY